MTGPSAAAPGPSEPQRRDRSGRRNLSYPDAPERLQVAVYDNHTHLDIRDGDNPLTLAEHLSRATDAGVAGVIQSSGDLESSAFAVWAAEQDERVLASVAIHPNEAPRYAQRGELDAAIAEIARLAEHPRVRAIGETGLDYFRTDESGRPAQLHSFEAHIALATEREIAMQIHDRDAHDDVLGTLRRVGAPERTVFHCFSGDADIARQALDLGAWLSFAGNVTFSSAHALREAVQVVPRDRLLVETDAPYLTPVPYRGRPNAPYLLPLTVRQIADVRGDEVSELAHAIAANTRTVYGEFHAAPTVSR